MNLPNWVPSQCKSTFAPLQLNRLNNMKLHVFKSSGERTYNSDNENIYHPKAWFPLVLRIVRIGDFHDLPTSGILTTSGNTPSQTCIPDSKRFLRHDRKNRKHFYFEGSVPDGPRRRRFLRWVWTWTLLVWDGPQQSGILTVSVNMKFACLGHRRCLILSPLATKPWFSVNYKCIILSTAAKN